MNFSQAVSKVIYVQITSLPDERMFTFTGVGETEIFVGVWARVTKHVGGGIQLTVTLTCTYTPMRSQ